MKENGSKRGVDFWTTLDGGRGVGAHVSLGAGHVSDVGSGLCLWLSFTQVTESCNWEPRNWVPGIPGGIFGRTVWLSSIICVCGRFRVVPRTGFGCLASTWGCMGARTSVAVWCCLDWFAIICSDAKELLYSSPNLEQQFCPNLVSWIWDNLIINCFLGKQYRKKKFSYENISAWFRVSWIRDNTAYLFIGEWIKICSTICIRATFQ